jgi:cytochrome c-type biogenesis protein CcmF
VHLGIVIMFVGFTGAAFKQDTTVEVKVGDNIHLGHYDLKVVDLREGDNENYSWDSALVEVSKDGRLLEKLSPERRMYKSSRQGTSEVAIRRRLNEDVYLNFAGMSDDNQRAVIQAFVFPLVSCVWLGYWVLLVGTLICLVPSKIKFQWARLPAIRVSQEHAETVKK